MFQVKNASIFCVSYARIFCFEKMTDLSFGKSINDDDDEVD